MAASVPPSLMLRATELWRSKGSLAPADRAVVVYIANKHSLDRPYESFWMCTLLPKLAILAVSTGCWPGEAVGGKKERKAERDERKL